VSPQVHDLYYSLAFSGMLKTMHAVYCWADAWKLYVSVFLLMGRTMCRLSWDSSKKLKQHLNKMNKTWKMVFKWFAHMTFWWFLYIKALAYFHIRTYASVSLDGLLHAPLEIATVIYGNSFIYRTPSEHVYSSSSSSSSSSTRRHALTREIRRGFN